MEDPAAAASFRTEAIRALEKARTLAPQDVIYALELASVLDSAERFAEAEWVFYDALQLDPKSISLRRYYERHLELWRGLIAPKEEGRELVVPASPQQTTIRKSVESLKKGLLSKITAATLRPT